jgi:hypothetical protein
VFPPLRLSSPSPYISLRYYTAWFILRFLPSILSLYLLYPIRKNIATISITALMVVITAIIVSIRK